MLLERCKDAVRGVDYAWVRSYQDPNLGFVANGLRYYAPVEYLGQSVLPSYFDSTLGARWGDGPLVGAHQSCKVAFSCSPAWSNFRTAAGSALSLSNMPRTFCGCH